MGTGYRVTFADFQRLLLDPEWRKPIAPLIRDWFGHEVVQDGASVIVRDKFGADVDISSLHAAIQNDPERQGRLYREAMTLWR